MVRGLKTTNSGQKRGGSKTKAVNNGAANNRLETTNCGAVRTRHITTNSDIKNSPLYEVSDFV